MPKILLAEDGLTAMNLAGGLFDDSTVELDVVTDGRSALERVNGIAGAYDLVILGYDLREISGPECIAFLRGMYRRLPVLVLSDIADEGRLDELTRLGIRRGRVLGKPTDPETFAAWVRKALSEEGRRYAGGSG